MPSNREQQKDTIEDEKIIDNAAESLAHIFLNQINTFVKESKLPENRRVKLTT